MAELLHISLHESGAGRMAPSLPPMAVIQPYGEKTVGDRRRLIQLKALIQHNAWPDETLILKQKKSDPQGPLSYFHTLQATREFTSLFW
ncbi:MULTISPECIES: hypothetical protein [Serratia]|uniref:Uncharacterized protein n=1 Tax=Serratia fonticola TaxID=47917 RepID=A0AAW3WM91_SERFO|nr:hypothetical protein [Serratia fonticola]MBC3211810.1 hypothetical protein [Serratia fonticola]MBP0997163.1 hypothetical protein [Serratia fonticola]MBP1002831.1 hypothetical protein [Serratia fonticola]MBP1012622.1 hypothetical protein [Serratia fonticola]MBP1018349.1 hypothetical protein [Serratia fonticola]